MAGAPPCQEGRRDEVPRGCPSGRRCTAPVSRWFRMSSVDGRAVAAWFHQDTRLLRATLARRQFTHAEVPRSCALTRGSPPHECPRSLRWPIQIRLRSGRHIAMQKTPRSGGGWKAIVYSLRMAKRVGWWKLWRAATSKNTCKTCAVGMGGQLGGMVNEGGHFPEVCKKSFQAMVSDMQAGIAAGVLRSGYGFTQLRALSPRQLEISGRLVRAAACRAGGHALSRRSPGTRPCSGSPTRCRPPGPTRSFFYASGRSSNEAGFLLQLLRAAVRHELRQQLLVLLPSGQRRRAGDAASAPGPGRSSSKTSTRPTCTS